MAKKTAPSTAPTRRRAKAASPAAADNSSRRPTGDGQVNPTPEEIAEAAYHRYLSRGGGDGRDFDDWLEAERELRERRGR